MTKALDLGCGAMPRNPFHADELTGIDLQAGGSVLALDLALQALPFADASIDYVSAFDLLGHIPRLLYLPDGGRRLPFVALLDEISRVLKPGGRLMAVTPAHPRAAVLGDPAQVNPFDEQTLALHFAGPAPLAVAQGFRGGLRLVSQEWRGSSLETVLEKAAAAADDAPLVSVFIPVYNGANYIAATLDAVLAQTLTQFEVIAVDDGSSDGSVAILDDYAARDARVRVFRTPVNQGIVAKVLNHSLPFMRGAYFVYSSQDDLFSPDWLASMHARASVSGADAVLPDLVFYYPAAPEKNRTLAGLHGDRGAELSGREALLRSLNWEIPGNALWRADLVRKLGFADFGLNSDEYSARVFFLNCNKVVFSTGIFYYRQDNAAAVTKKITSRTFDYAYTQLMLYRLLRDNAFAAELVQQEAIKTVRLLNELTQWLVQHGATLGEEGARQAALRLERTRAEMTADPMFAAVM